MKLSRRWLINYFLFVLIVLFTWIGNRYDLQTGEQKANAVSTLEANRIDRFSIQTTDEAIEIKRDDSGWQITSPIQWPADQVNMERMLDITNAETDSKIAASEIDLNEFGLQFPRTSMRLNDTSVAFGITNNIGERRYTMIDSTVYLLPDIYHPFISQGLLAVVDRRLLPGSLNLQSLQLPDLVIARDDQAWLKDGEAASDSVPLEDMVGNWQGLEATRIKRFNSTATPRQKIIVELANGEILEYFLMSIAPEIVIAHPRLGLQYHFSDDHYYQLVSLPHDETS